MKLALKQQPRSFYVLLLLLAIWLFWAIFFTHKWADRQLDSYASRTSALLYQLSGDLQNLPEPEYVKPGRSSGNAAGVITKYEEARDSLYRASESLSPPLLARLIAFRKADSLTAQNKMTAGALGKAADELDKLVNAMSVSKKFIEYVPEADLINLDDPNSDSDERLERTRDGLLKTAEELKKTGYGRAEQMAQMILPLAEEVPTLKSASLPGWADKVLKVQAQYVKTFQNDWQPYVQDKSSTLRADAGAFISHQ